MELRNYFLFLFSLFIVFVSYLSSRRSFVNRERRRFQFFKATAKGERRGLCIEASAIETGERSSLSDAIAPLTPFFLTGHSAFLKGHRRGLTHYPAIFLNKNKIRSRFPTVPFIYAPLYLLVTFLFYLL